MGADWCGGHILDYAGDNTVTAYVNGVKVGSGIWQRTQRYEFEVTASGWILFAFELVNAAGRRRPRREPDRAPVVAARRNGTVVARSDDDTEILEYPSSDPQVPIGRQIRQVMIGNDLLDGWTVTGTETTDDSGATFPATGPMVYRLGRTRRGMSCRSCASSSSTWWSTPKVGRCVRS